MLFYTSGFQVTTRSPRPDVATGGADRRDERSAETRTNKVLNRIRNKSTKFNN